MWPEAHSFGALETETENEFWHMCKSHFKFPSNHQAFPHPVSLKDFTLFILSVLKFQTPQNDSIQEHFLLLLATGCHVCQVCVFTFRLWKVFDRTLLYHRFSLLQQLPVAASTTLLEQLPPKSQTMQHQSDRTVLTACLETSNAKQHV